MGASDDQRKNKSTSEIFEGLLVALPEKCAEFYGPRLISLVVYGSVGRRLMTPESDIDFLLVVDPLPHGRFRRVKEFESVERALAGVLERRAITESIRSCPRSSRLPARCVRGARSSWTWWMMPASSSTVEISFREN